MQKKYWIKTKDYEIPAILTYSEQIENAPCMILCHGTGSHKDEVGNMFWELAEGLCELGIASIRFDFAGCGESMASEQELTFLGEVNDTLAVYDFLREIPEICQKRIGILGFSQGARVMAEVLKKIPELKCAVSWSGACHDGEGIFSDWFVKYYDEALKNGYARIPMDWREDLLISKEWFEEIRNTKPMTGFMQYEGPVLVMAGRKDMVVSCEHSKEIMDLCTNQESMLKIYDNADHIFCALEKDQKMEQDVVIDTVLWINKHI